MLAVPMFAGSLFAPTAILLRIVFQPVWQWVFSISIFNQLLPTHGYALLLSGLLDFCLMAYFTLACFLGMSSVLQKVFNFRLYRGATSPRYLLGVVFLMVPLAASLPLCARNLGLAQLNVLGYVSTFSELHVLPIYRTLFVTISVALAGYRLSHLWIRCLRRFKKHINTAPHNHVD